MTDGDPRSAVRTLGIAMAASVICVFPMFLTGALAVELRTQLNFGAAGLGVAVAAFRVSAAAASGYLGTLTDRFGATVSLRLGVLIAGFASIGVAVLARSWTSLVIWLFIAGAGQALCQPAANRMLVNRIPLRRRGIAFGFKQSAPPAASMLAGISLPVIALTVGWRWAYALVPVLAVIVVLVLGRRRTSPDSVQPKKVDPATRPSVVTIVTLMLAFGLGTAASGTVPAFYVDAAVGAGTPSQLAGILLAVASLAAVCTRLLTGALCDRLHSGHLRLCIALLMLGALGLGSLAAGSPMMMAIGAIIALAGTWGYNAVFWYSITRAFPASPGAITGAIAPGGLIGGIIGPIAFGVLVEAVDYRVAWIFAAVLSMSAAGAMVFGARQLPSSATS